MTTSSAAHRSSSSWSIAAAALVLGLGPGCGSRLVFSDGVSYDGTSSTTIVSAGHVETVKSWGSGGHGYRFEWSGSKWPSIRADDRGFERLPEGELTVSEIEGDHELAKLTIVSDGSTESARFWRDGREEPFEPGGAEWLAEAVPVLIDTVGLGASSRVPRLLATGAQAFLDDVERRRTDLARSQYYEFALEWGELGSTDAVRVLVHAGEHVASDAHLAEILEEAAEVRAGDDVVLEAIVTAAASIDSDAHLTEVLEAVVEDGRIEGEGLVALLDLAGSRIGSDAHLADLLEDVADEASLRGDAMEAFVTALSSVDSDAHAADVVEDVIGGGDLSDAMVERLLRVAAAGISSDAHLEDVLEEVPARRLSDEGVLAAFVDALRTVDSDAHAADVVGEMLSESNDPRVAAELVAVAGAGIASDAHLADVLGEVRSRLVEHEAVRASMLRALETIDSRAHREDVLERFPALGD